MLAPSSYSENFKDVTTRRRSQPFSVVSGTRGTTEAKGSKLASKLSNRLTPSHYDGRVSVRWLLRFRDAVDYSLQGNLHGMKQVGV